MHRFARPFVLAAIAIASAASTRASAQASSTPCDRARLLQLEDTWTSALVKRDGATFNRLLAPGFVYTEDDRLMTREEVLREVVSGADTVTASHNEGMKVHLFGSTGIVTGILVVQGRSKGAPFDRRYRFTDTWVKKANGTWQIVAAQDYLIPGRK